MESSANLSIPSEFRGIESMKREERFSLTRENGGWKHPALLGIIENLYRSAGLWFPRRDLKPLSVSD
ncbi:MAG: hypothetical protein M3338_03570 [Actinomycetota bacterium]|nr:hypothetical protein [Actinomycetota bacterium]